VRPWLSRVQENAMAGRHGRDHGHADCFRNILI
jgi:hypothetical protein